MENCTDEFFDDMSSVEMAFIGILLTKPEKINSVRHLVDKYDFQHVESGEVFEILKRRADEGLFVDAFTAKSVIDPEIFGGEQKRNEYIADCVGSVVSEIMLKPYACAIREARLKRDINSAIASGAKLVDKAKAISEMLKDYEDATVMVHPSHISEALARNQEKVDEVYKLGTYAGLKTGLETLDKKLCGMDKGGLYVLAGRPSMGKTAMALTIACNVAQTGVPVLFFSLEMSAEQLAQRITARFTSNTILNQKTGQNVNFFELNDLRSKYETVPLYVIDKGDLTADSICAKALLMKKKIDIGLVVIDHLAIMKPSEPNVSRVYQIASMTRKLKSLAKDMDCPVLLLHQLNRGVEGREDKRPTLSDLRDSGSVEQDADVVMLLYREEYYLINKTETDLETWKKIADKLDAVRGKAEIIIAKNRQGSSGTVVLNFSPEKQEFFESKEKA